MRQTDYTIAKPLQALCSLIFVLLFSIGGVHADELTWTEAPEYEDCTVTDDFGEESDCGC